VDVSRRDVVTAGLSSVLGTRTGPAPGDASFTATDLLTGRRVEHRAERPCPVLTLSAGLALGLLLRERGVDELTRVVRFTRGDVVRSSPVCAWHLQQGLSLARLGDAALRRGDATATNLLVRHVGGPAALTGFCRELGDQWTRLDRAAPASCGGDPWDPRDTTTVTALALDHALLLLGRVLPPGSRGVLTGLFPTVRLAGGWEFSGSTATARYGSVVAVGTARRDRRRVVLAAAVRSGQPGTWGSERALVPVLADVLAGLDRRW
jgi:beta-lactamase class A